MVRLHESTGVDKLDSFHEILYGDVLHNNNIK